MEHLYSPVTQKQDQRAVIYSSFQVAGTPVKKWKELLLSTVTVASATKSAVQSAVQCLPHEFFLTMIGSKIFNGPYPQIGTLVKNEIGD